MVWCSRERIEKLARSTMGFESIFNQEGLTVSPEDLQREMNMSIEQFTASGTEFDQEKLQEQAIETCKVPPQNLIYCVQGILCCQMLRMVYRLCKRPLCCYGLSTACIFFTLQAGTYFLRASQCFRTIRGGSRVTSSSIHFHIFELTDL